MGGKKNLSFSFPFCGRHPWDLVVILSLPSPHPCSGQWGWVQRQIWQPRRRHCDCSYGDGGPQDLGKTLPIVRPGGGKHGKCESLPRSISPGLCQVYLPPSLSSQSRPKREGVEVGSGQTLQGLATTSTLGLMAPPPEVPTMWRRTIHDS